MKSYTVEGRTFTNSCDVREWTYILCKKKQLAWAGKPVSIDRYDVLIWGLFDNSQNQWVYVPEIERND